MSSTRYQDGLYRSVDISADRVYLQRYDAALKAYRVRDFDGAVAGFAAAREALIEAYWPQP